MNILVILTADMFAAFALKSLSYSNEERILIYISFIRRLTCRFSENQCSNNKTDIRHPIKVDNSLLTVRRHAKNF
ncbi:MAG: hypothetical protein ACLS5X_00725 [Eubacterium sp.]